MKTAQTIASLILIVIGVLFCFFSLRVGLGRINDPGPGFIPFVTGCALILLSLGTIFFEGKPGRKEESESKPPKETDSGWVLPASVLLSLLIYALVLEFLGFFLSTFLFLTFLLMMSEKRSWKASLGFSILTTGSAYLVFGYLLEVGLPQGFLGF